MLLLANLDINARSKLVLGAPIYIFSSLLSLPIDLYPRLDSLVIILVFVGITE